MTKEQIAAELEMVRQKSGGLLHARAVVDFARKHKSSALYEQFEWSNSKAAEAYRLQQAREVIRATVVILQSPGGDSLPVRAYVSLRSDRSGYRATIEVLGNRDLAGEALTGFIRDIEKLRAKYSTFAILAGLLDEVSERVQAEHKQKGRRKKAAG